MIIHPDPRDGVALAAFKSEWWPASRRNSGRLQIGTPGRLRRNTQVIPLALGRDAGIRDLAPLPDGQILVLAGPAQDQLEVHFALFALDLREGRFTRLATLDDPQGICTPGPRAISGKPEAVLPLGLDEDCLRVLILSDSLPNGAPCEYRVPRQ